MDNLANWSTQIQTRASEIYSRVCATESWSGLKDCYPLGLGLIIGIPLGMLLSLGFGPGTDGPKESFPCTSCPSLQFKNMDNVLLPFGASGTVIRKYIARKPIGYLLARNGLGERNGKLVAGIGIYSAPEIKCRGAKFAQLDYTKEATVINTLHNELLKNRLESPGSKNTGITNSKLSDANPNVLKSASFVSVKLISHSDHLDLASVMRNLGAGIHSKLDQFETLVSPFGLERMESKGEEMQISPCTSSKCIHQSSKVAVFPMTLEQPYPPDCDWPKKLVGWSCDLPWPLSKGCHDLDNSRCSLSQRYASWDSSGMKKDCTNCPVPQMTNVLISILLCH